MRVFVTGATGFVGTAVVRELLANGHSVLGLARSDARAAELVAAGAEVHRGSLEDVESLKRGAAAADAVAHLAFNHDFSKYQENCEEDRRAIEAMGSVFEGSQRQILVTGGLAMLAPDRVATEEDMPSPGFPRASEAAAASLAARGVRASTVRLPPTTHGQGDHGFMHILITLAREKGHAAYVGNGENRWPAGHRFDAARVYRLALERGVESGPFHAVAEEGVAMKKIAETIGRHLRLPVVSKTAEEAADYFGWFAMFAGADLPTSSARTRKLLDWQPGEPELLADMEQNYFND